MKPDTMPSYLQQQIKTRMEAKQLTTSGLERKAGTTRNAVWQILQGTSKNPRAEVLKAIAKVFECTVDELITPSQNDVIAMATQSHNLDKKLYVDTATKENHKWNEKLYLDITKAVSKIITDKKLDLKLEQIAALIGEGYRYSAAKASDKADKDFINWLFNKHFK
jgi:transcriptional regulator with XRE-family HTH domain